MIPSSGKSGSRFPSGESLAAAGEMWRHRMLLLRDFSFGDRVGFAQDSEFSLPTEQSCHPPNSVQDLSLYLYWQQLVRAREENETTVEEGNRDAVGNHWPFKTFFKSFYYCKDELAINSWMDRQSLMCKRMGLRQFSIIWEISVLIEAFRASMRVEL